MVLLLTAERIPQCTHVGTCPYISHFALTAVQCFHIALDMWLPLCACPGVYESRSLNSASLHRANPSVAQTGKHVEADTSRIWTVTRRKLS